MYPKVSTQPVVKLCSVVTAGRLSLGRCYSYAAFFARSTYGRGTLVATPLVSEGTLYFAATILYHRCLFQKPGRFHFRLVNCLYRLGCYTAQSTDFSLHPVSGTVSLRQPPVHVTVKLSSTRVIELSRTCQYSLLQYARALLLSGFFAPAQRYSISLLCHSQPDGFTLSPPWSPPYSLTAWSSFCSRLCQPPVCRSGALNLFGFQFSAANAQFFTGARSVLCTNLVCRNTLIPHNPTAFAAQLFLQNQGARRFRSPCQPSTLLSQVSSVLPPHFAAIRLRSSLPRS